MPSAGIIWIKQGLPVSRLGRRIIFLSRRRRREETLTRSVFSTDGTTHFFKVRRQRLEPTDVGCFEGGKLLLEMGFFTGDN